MNEAFEQWRQDQDKYNMPTHEETFRAGMLAAAEICEQVVEYPPGYNGQWEGYGPVRITRTGNDCAAAIREAAKK